MSDPLQALLGIKASVVIAALVGAVLGALGGQGPWWQRSLRVSVGFATSLYLTPVALDIVGPMLGVGTPRLEHAVAFVCGYIGMGILDATLDAVRKRIAKFGSG
jgi:hypothetical protein